MAKKGEVEIRVVEDWTGAVETDGDSTVKNVKVLGFDSLNGRVYPPEVVKAAVPLYEGAKVNIDHPEPGKPSAARTYRDRFGVLKNARFVEGSGIVADFHFNPRHAVAEQFRWDAKNNPSSLGFSHNALTRVSSRRDPSGREVVEQIVRVRHVDLVADPATTRSLFESELMDPTAAPTVAAGSSDPLEMIVDSIAAKIGEIAKMDGDPKEKMKQIADLLKKQDKIMGLLKPADASSDDSKAPATEQVDLRKELTQVRQLLEQYQAKEKAAVLQATIESELAAAGLDRKNPLHVSELFAKQLLEAKSADERGLLIKDRKALVSAAPARSPFSAPVSGSTFTQATEMDSKSFVSRLKS